MEQYVECRTLRTFFNSHEAIQRRRTNETFKAPVSIAMQLVEHGVIESPELAKHTAAMPKEKAPEEPLNQEADHLIGPADQPPPVEEQVDDVTEDPPPEDEPKGGKKRANRK